MRSSASASITSSASRASRFWVPSQREYRKLAGMGLLTTLHLAPGYLAGSLLMAGELDRGLAAAEESVAMADDLGTPRVIRMARGVLVDAHWRRGDIERALAQHRLNLAIGPVDPWRNVTDLARMAALLIAAGKAERGVR